MYAHPTALTALTPTVVSVGTADVLTLFGDFGATTATVTAVSDAGRELFAAMFGEGAVSVELPKSRWADFVEYCERRGLVAR